MTIRPGWPSFEQWQQNRQVRCVIRALPDFFETFNEAMMRIGEAAARVAKNFNEAFEELKDANQHINEYPAPHQEEADSEIRFPRRW